MTDDRTRMAVAARLRCADATMMFDLTDSVFIDTLADLIGFECDDGECYEASLFGHLADLIEPPACHMDDRGVYMPHHEFRRMACSECGGMHWEQPQRTLPRMRYCPWCGAVVE